VLKNGALRRDPALCGFCKCSHMTAYAALSKTPHALADGLMLVFQYPVKSWLQMQAAIEPFPTAVCAGLTQSTQQAQ
jgi:hypothetical protein